MNIKSITLHRVSMNLKTPFVTSNGAYVERESIIVEMEDEDGVIGWGECVAFATPWYTEETTDTAWMIIEKFLIPELLSDTLNHPSQLSERFDHIRRNRMAKAGLEMAVWDLYSQKQGVSLSQVIGGTQKEIQAGVAIGLQKDMDQLYRTIEHYESEGYQRFKVKIKPGQDISLISGIRQRFPKLPLMADANSAYTLKDIDVLQRLDEFQLMMIEQPLGADDIIDHAKLQTRLITPICLDESIVTYEDAYHAIELGSCRVMNIKLGRVGGYTEAIRIHDLCMKSNISLWCGGMLETGIGRAHNIALASLSQFQLPGDISASSRYWQRDIIQPEVTLHHGCVKVTNTPGLGYEIDRSFLASVTLQKQTYTK